MEIFKTFEIRKHRTRIQWVLDHDYAPDDTHRVMGWTPTSEEQAHHAEERKNLASGKWAALGCIVEKRCTHCGEWKQTDSLWGIVIEPTDEALKTFAKQNMDFSKQVKV